MSPTSHWNRLNHQLSPVISPSTLGVTSQRDFAKGTRSCVWSPYIPINPVSMLIANSFEILENRGRRAQKNQYYWSEFLSYHLLNVLGILFDIDSRQMLWRHILRDIGMEAMMLNIQHYLNPLHVHCRLVEMGLKKTLSKSVCKYYEILIYGWLASLTVSWVNSLRILKTWTKTNLKASYQRAKDKAELATAPSFSCPHFVVDAFHVRVAIACNSSNLFKFK